MSAPWATTKWSIEVWSIGKHFSWFRKFYFSFIDHQISIFNWSNWMHLLHFLYFLRWIIFFLNDFSGFLFEFNMYYFRINFLIKFFKFFFFDKFLLKPENYFFSIWALLSGTFMNHRTARKGRGYSINLPSTLPPASWGYYREITSAYS